MRKTPQNLDITTSEGLEGLYTAIFDLTSALWACRSSVTRLELLMKQSLPTEDEAVEIE